MGRSRARRSTDIRVPDAGIGPGRPELVHHSPQAGELSPQFRRVRSAESRPLLGKKIETLLQDPGIVRNRLKVHAAVTNARCFLEVQNEFGSFDAYIWTFVDSRPVVNQPRNADDCPVTTPQSDALSRDLKRRGFKFVGSTIVYAHMQATGMVNDHSKDCSLGQTTK